mgnify:CR=1 FL=1
MVIECYAQRLLNPFRGAMLTIRYEAAEAVTLDGLRWDIYVANRDGSDERRLTRDIQHDVLPRFIGATRLLSVVDERDDELRATLAEEAEGQSVKGALPGNG